MKRILKISSFLCLLLVVAGLAGCAAKKTPQISDPNGVFAKVGDQAVTNEKVYLGAKAGYGLDELLRLIDTQLLATELAQVTDVKIDEAINKAKYGTADKNTLTATEVTDIEEAFANAQKLAGRLTETDIRSYYRLEIARREYALAKFKADILQNETTNNKGYFTDEQYQNYFKANYRPDVTAIVATFVTEYEARQVMNFFNVKVDETGNKWVNASTGADLTPAELYQTFVNIYNYVNAYKVIGNAFPIEDGDYTVTNGKFAFTQAYLDKMATNKNLKVTYSYKDLSSTSVLATKLFEDYGLKAYDPALAGTDANYTDQLNRTYTINPSASGTSKFYLILKVGVGPAKTLDEVKPEIKEKLTENALTSTEIGKQLFKMRRDAKLVMFDYQFNAAYATVDTDYKPTKKTNKTVVATYNVNGQATNVTADDLFAVLAAKHGAYIASDLLDRAALTHDATFNDVYDFSAKKVLNKDAYNQLKASVNGYKTDFENNTYANYGFPSTYGWKEFMRDFYGVKDEEELALTVALYEYTLKKFREQSYTPTDVRDQMNKMVDQFFEATVISLIVFVDYDDNNLPDKNVVSGVDPQYSKWTQLQKDLALELTGVVKTEKDKYLVGTDYAKAFSQVIEQYNNALQINTTWGKYKAAGLRLKFEATGTVNNNTAQSQEVKNTVKSLWTLQKDSNLLGKEIKPARWSEAFNTPSDIRIVGITKTTDYTYANSSATPKVILPTNEQIAMYNADPNDADITTSVRNAIIKWYVPAVEALKSENANKTGRINIKLMEYTESKTVTFTDPTQLDVYKQIIDIYKAEYQNSIA